MISDTYQITDAASRAHALSETERMGGFAGLTPEEAGRLRLVAEEMLTLTDRLLDTTGCAFHIETQGKKFELHLNIQADIDEAQRKKLIAVSSTGENTAAKGILGKLASMLDSFLSNPDDASFLTVYSESASMAQVGMYTYAWSMTEAVKKEAKAEPDEWDDLEKSILAKYADDVIVGVRSRRLEIISKMQF